MPRTSAPARRADLAALGLRRKSVDCQFKAIDEDGGFKVYFAVFGNLDRGGDVLEPRSVRNADEFLKDGWIAWNHLNQSLPIGYPTAVSQDGAGLLVEGKFHSTPEAQAVRTVAMERMRAGKSVKGSIGYVSADETYEKVDGQTIRRLKQIDVYECSFVNLPMNPLAAAQAVKSAPHPTAAEDAMSDSAAPSITAKATAALEALKEWLTGVETKGGKPISQAARTRLKSFAQAMGEHGDATRAHAKAMHEHGKAAQLLGRECAKFLKDFDPDDDAADEPDGDGDESEDAPDEKPARKAAPAPQAKAQAAEQPAAKSAPDRTLETYRETLRFRALLGRRHQSCP